MVAGEKYFDNPDNYPDNLAAKRKEPANIFQFE
jgi:hypothetical protein